MASLIQSYRVWGLEEGVYSARCLRVHDSYVSSVYLKPLTNLKNFFLSLFFPVLLGYN